MLRYSIRIAARSAAFALTLLISRAEAADAQQIREAKAHFSAGLDHLRGHRYDEAYREFTAAYESSRKWTVLGNLGIAADHLERDGEAINFFEKYLEEGRSEISAEEERQVRADLERLHGGSATVTLEGPGHFWIVDTRTGKAGQVVNHYGPFRDRAEVLIRAGRHEFRLERAQRDLPAWAVTLLPGDTATHVFAASERDPSETSLRVESVDSSALADQEASTSPPSHTTSYVLWGVGAVAVAATTVMYVESRRLQNEADEAFDSGCPNGANRADAECASALADDATAAHWRTAAVITGVGALGVLIGGLVLYHTLDSRSTADRDRGAGENAEALKAWIGPTGFGVSGSF